MKKILILTVCIVVMMGFTGCGGSAASTATSDSESVSENNSVASPSTNQSETLVDVESLSSGDEVSIVGQVASTGLVNGNTVWVQVSQSDGTFVIYHCQLQDSFIGEGEGLKLLDSVKIKGLFLSLMKSSQENTSPLVTLYDCEII